MNIIKRSGEEVTFDGSKIVAAVEKANHEVTDDKRLSDAEIDGIEAELILAEGAAYTPAVMRSRGMRDYITIIPTPEFQISHYRERPWVPRILAGCSDKDAAVLTSILKSFSKNPRAK